MNKTNTQSESGAIKKRLEYLRGELRAGKISYGELVELKGLADRITPDDVELLESAGVPENRARHTPTPWHCAFSGPTSTPSWTIHPGKTFKRAIEERPICFMPETTTETVEEVSANAEFIVLAVNSHDVLLSAIKMVAKEFEPGAKNCGTISLATVRHLERLIASLATR